VHDAERVQQVGRLLDALRTGSPVERADVIRVLRTLDGDLEVATSLVSEAVTRFPRHGALRLQAGRALLRAGDGTGAVRQLRKALALGADEAATRLSLARALVAAGAPLDEVDEAFAAAVLARDDDIVLVRDWRSVPRGPHDVPLDERLAAVQESASRPLPGVLRMLLLDGPDGPHAARCAAQAERFLDDEPAAACRRVWDAYCALRPIEAVDAERVAELPIEVLQLFFLAQPLRVVPFDEATTAGLGLDAGAVRWWSGEFQEPDVPRPAERVFQSDAHRVRVLRDDELLGYQTRAVRERQMVLRDLVSGKPSPVMDGVLFQGRAVYSFGESELTWMIAFGEGFRASFLALPGRGVLLDLGSGLGRHHVRPARMSNLYAHLLRRVARLHERFADALARPVDPDAQRAVVLQVSAPENFAHHVWNLYPTLERIVALGLADRVAEVRTAGTQFFGPLAELFPELDRGRVVEEERQSVRDPYPFSQDHLVIAPGGYFITGSLVQRIRDRMSALPATPGFDQPPTVRDDRRPFPVVWIGVRVRSRAWVDQEHEIPQLVDALLDKFPDAVVVLDGYSYPVANDLISERWQASIDELAAVAAAIREAVSQPDRVVDLVGSTLREAVLWAEATDVYVAPNGTSQHKVGWFTDDPGIVYAPPSLAAISPHARPGAREAEGRPVPVTVFGEPVEAGERRWGGDVRPHLENIRIDGAHVLELIVELLEARATSSSSPSHDDR
jgi:hypothetical protein